MDQHTARTSRYHRPAPRRPARAGPARLLPRPRLTALGTGVLAAGAMLSAGAVDQLLLDGSRTVYGVVFVLASVACAIWVRPADLVAAPVAAPIAFAAGLLVTANPMGMVTGLALRAGWLYGGTLTAVLIVLIRKRLLHTARRPVSPR